MPWTAANGIDIVFDMKTISVSVSSQDYEAFRRSARRSKRSIAQLIREAMAFYREERLDQKSRLAELPALAGPRAVSSLPGKAELYEEIFGANGGTIAP
jgi:hypothetical protein